ncbi:hypothetical protein [Flaviaesturariibacter amylovorans]|uniref:T9SS type A sorting domain-containing protein n=1 Tax=Flaviaesturariibacter amylovorans TaxID=1084520 RepID=A0ABP8H727_9BACT
MTKRYSLHPFLLMSLLLPFAGAAQRTTDPTPPATPVYASQTTVNPGYGFGNIAFDEGGNINASFFTSGRVTDGTGSAEFDDYVTGNMGANQAYLIMNQATLRIATHIFSDNTNPFRHDVANTITQQRWEADFGLSNPGWTFLFGRNEFNQNSQFPQLSIINFQNYIIDQSIGAGPFIQPVGLSNVLVTITGTMTFTNGNIYALRQDGLNLNLEEFVFQSGASTAGGSATSYLDAPMRVLGATNNFKFVLGDQGIYSPLTYTGSNPGANGTVARYFANGGGNTASLNSLLTSVSPEEYYAISSTDNAATLTLNTANFPTYTGANWTIAGFNGTQWVNLRPGGGAGTINGNEVTVTGANLTGITRIAPALATSLLPLPLNFVSFKAVALGSSAKLDWDVADVVNVSHFVVERSCDGNNFTAIGQVSLTSASSYTYLDVQPCAPISYYRVRSVDFDGSTKMTPVRNVRFALADARFTLWPNPARGSSIQIMLSRTDGATAAKAIQWQIRTVAGQVVKEGKATLQGGTPLQIGLDGLSNGTYQFTSIAADGATETLAFIKQ